MKKYLAEGARHAIFQKKCPTFSQTKNKKQKTTKNKKTKKKTKKKQKKKNSLISGPPQLMIATFDFYILVSG